METPNLVILIPTFSYAYKSAGIHAQHKLCHLLRTNGYNAFLVPLKHKMETNPDWDTPLWRGSKKPITSIAIYSELLPGNPLRANHQIHWILGEEYNAASLTSGNILKWNSFGKNSLRVDLHGESISTLSSYQRQGFAAYNGKVRCKKIPGLKNENLTIINRFGAHAQRRDEIIGILKKVKAIFVAEDSMIIEEALLHGCPVVICPGPFKPDDANKLPALYCQADTKDLPMFDELLEGIPLSKLHIMNKRQTSVETFRNLSTLIEQLSQQNQQPSLPRTKVGIVARLTIFRLRISNALEKDSLRGLVHLLVDASKSRIFVWTKH